MPFLPMEAIQKQLAQGQGANQAQIAHSLQMSGATAAQKQQMQHNQN